MLKCPQCFNYDFYNNGPRPLSPYIEVECVKCKHKMMVTASDSNYKDSERRGMFVPRSALHPSSGSVKKAVEKLKNLDRDSFIYGVPKEQLQKCPGCGKRSCYYIGGGPGDVECANRDCKFFIIPLPEDTKRYHFGFEKPYEDDEDTKEINLDDIEDYFENTGFGD